MEAYNFVSNIGNNIDLELSRLHVHLRGNDLAKHCHVEALDIVIKSGFIGLTERREAFVLASKIRDMLKYASSNQKWDYPTLSVEPDDEEKGNLNIYKALDNVARAISNIYVAGVLHNGYHVNQSDRIDFCKSLLWLIAMSLNVSQDLHHDYFRSRK